MAAEACTQAELEPVSPSKAPLRSTGDLTLEEIEDSFSSLKLSLSGKPFAAQDGRTGEKPQRIEREIHHLDASATSSSHERAAAPQTSGKGPPKRPERDNEGSHHKASPARPGRQHPTAAQPDVEVFNLEDGPPSRTASPAVTGSKSAARRISSQVSLFWANRLPTSPVPLAGTVLQLHLVQQFKQQRLVVLCRAS